MRPPSRAEITLVGTGSAGYTLSSSGVFDLYPGGVFDGTRLFKPYRAEIDCKEIVTALEPIFAYCVRDRLADGRFGNCVIRILCPDRREPGHCGTVS